ncbi:MAG: alpha/beta fold hydrolase [Methylococcaceae bacterium]|nr:alpha/beta fold hydrolase [Methylococcaceae bacterium]
MSADLPAAQEYEIVPSTYEWSVRVFRTLKKLLSVNVKLHSEKSAIERGEIFLFNHFARFETFIPQYLIYEETGSYCFSVAHREFFAGDDVLSNYLTSVGAVPHDHENLLPILSRQVLKGRKIIIFPEGGMVKDRQVVDHKGEYSIFSRSTMGRRKQHTGAAVLALGVDALKKIIRNAYYYQDKNRLERWCTEIGIDHIGSLLEAALRPTVIVPANITFYPIRINENLLRKGAELLNSGLTRRHSEELLIEGNILLKDTDMDIRFGTPILAESAWRWWERELIDRISPNIDSIDRLFDLHTRAASRSEKLLAAGIKRNAHFLRDLYMEYMYQAVTVNISHLASSIIMLLLKRGDIEISRSLFHKALYLAVKSVQKIPSIHLHRSLLDPDVYRHLEEGNNKGLEQFLYMAESSELIEPLENSYRFLPKLVEEHDFDTIRMENLVAVYANEVAPLPFIRTICENSLNEASQFDQVREAALHFDDELMSWKWDKQIYSKPGFDELNQLETATEDSRPFFFLPKQNAGAGVILVHGLLASPAEVRSFGERLFEQGYVVIGVRLKGHGTSPKDLRERQWEDWYDSVLRAYSILQQYADQIHVVGFSTGGALALRLASDQPDSLTGVSAISVPIKFRDPKMMFVPLVHGTNKLVRWISSYEGVKPFLQNKPEHPTVNYQNIPIRGLYELRRLIAELETRLGDVHCPVLLIQANKDPTVDPKSADIILRKLGSPIKELLSIESDRHGILMENIGRTQESISTFIQRCANLLPYARAYETYDQQTAESLPGV